jgi:hypothetical protein
MKASIALKKATKLREQTVELMKPISEALIEILEDDSTHITFQPGDGWCVCYVCDGFSHNALLSSSYVDELLAMKKNELLIALDTLGI